MHDDIYTEVVFLRHILNFIVLPGDGSASRPARTCRELMIAHPKKRNGMARSYSDVTSVMCGHVRYSETIHNQPIGGVCVCVCVCVCV